MYDIDWEHPIHQGSFGTLYRAYWTGNSSFVALKVANASKQAAELLKHEYQALQLLSTCEHVPCVHSFSTALNPSADPRLHGRACLAMEYLEGCSLEEYVKGRTLSKRDATTLALEVLSIIAIVHRYGVLHCDLHPGNIFITDTGSVKVIDFGASCNCFRNNESVVINGFQPPEGECARPRWYKASDVYEIANVVAYCRYGRVLDWADLPQDAFGKWLATCLQPHFENRFPTCDAAIAALKETLMVAPNALDRAKRKLWVRMK